MRAATEVRKPVSGRRLWRIVWSLTGINIRARMEYRFDFMLWLLFGMVFQVAALTFVWVIVARFGGVGGWTLHEVLFIVGIRLVSHALTEALLGNITTVTWMIRDGWFDRILVRPVNALLQVLLVSFRANGVGDLLVGIFVFIAAQRGLGVHWTPLSVAFLLLVILGSMALEAGLLLAIAASSFWFVRTEALAWWADDASNTFANYPLSIFPFGVRTLLTYVFPIAFLGFFPAAVFLGRTGDVPFTPLFAYGAPVVGVAVFVAAYRLWMIGIRRHQSTGT